MLERAVKCMNEKCHCLDIRLLWFSAKWAKPEMWLSWKLEPEKKIAYRPGVWSRVTMWALVFMDITKLISIISVIVWSADGALPLIFEQHFLIGAIKWNDNEIRHEKKYTLASPTLRQPCPIVVFLRHVELNENDNNWYQKWAILQ